MASAVSYLDTAIGPDYDYLFKVLLIGDSGVGKSSLVERFTEPQSPFDPNFVSTIGVDFRIKTFQYNGKVVKLQIWDTAGQERFRSITTSYYRGAHGIIMAYDVTDPRSLRNVAGVWLKEVDKYANPEATLLLIGNKSDLAGTFPVEVESSRKMAGQMEEGKLVGRLETSAKTGEGVEKAFLSLVDDMMAKQHAKAVKAMEGGKNSSKTHRLRFTSTPVEGGRESRCC